MSKLSEAQALTWKHKYNLGVIPQKIRENLFSGEEYGNRIETLKETDKELRRIALGGETKDRKSTRLNSSHITRSRMPSSA